MLSNKPENTQFRRMSAEDEEMFVKPGSSPVMVSFLSPWSLIIHHEVHRHCTIESRHFTLYMRSHVAITRLFLFILNQEEKGKHGAFDVVRWLPGGDSQ